MYPKEMEVLNIAKGLAMAVLNRVEFVEKLFGENGLLRKAYPDKKERDRFVRSIEYQMLWELIYELEA